MVLQNYKFDLMLDLVIELFKKCLNVDRLI